MRKQRLFAAALAALAILAPQGASGLAQGDSVTILVPTAQLQPQPPSGAHDRLRYHGGAVGSIDIAGCGSGNHPVQDATLVDLSGGHSGPITVITATEVEPVPPGTSLAAFSANGSCTIGSTTYNRYLATVERVPGS